MEPKNPKNYMNTPFGGLNNNIQNNQLMLMQQMFITLLSFQYKQFCENKGLNPNDPNSIMSFYHSAFYLNQPNEVISNKYNDIKAEEKSNKKFSINLMNIAFKSSTETDVILTFPINFTIKEMFERYMDRLRLPVSYINYFIFISNGTKVDPFSTDYVETKFKNNDSITVFERDAVIGGVN